MADEVTIRRAQETDIPKIAALNEEGFEGNRGGAEEWIRCWWSSYPMYQYFVAVDGDVVGYIGWQVHGGFQRRTPVVELEQLAVAESHRGKGIAQFLIDESLATVIAWLKEKDKNIEGEVKIIVWGYSSNLAAMKVYLRSFDDGVVGTRLQYGGADKVESMFRKQIKI